MGFLSLLRHRLTEAVHQHPSICNDPLFGKMELAGTGIWQTTEPIELVPGTQPITIMIEGEPGPATRAAFEELQRRYLALQPAIGPMLCKTAPRVRPKKLWDHASLSSLEIWREPVTGKPVFALEYELDDAPEYAYIVRLENWRPVDVLVVG